MIEKNELWNIIDSSKLEDYQACPRRYLFQHIFGWRYEEPSVHLHHGKCWHKVQRHLLKNGYTAKAATEAINLYEECYREAFPDPSTDFDRFPKVPGTVLEAVTKYIKEFREVDKDQKVLYTEIGGTVIVGDGVVIHFKMDSILQDSDGLYFSREHKTASRHDRKWEMQFTLSPQVGTYLHALHCLYPTEEVKGIEINGSFWLKKDTNFYRILIRKKLELMEAWRINMLSWIEDLKADTLGLTLHKEELEDAPVLGLFKQNPQTCDQYFGCIFHPYCSSWANPLQHSEEPPLGYKVEFWDPRREDLERKVEL